LRFGRAFTSVLADLTSALNDIGDLKGESGPGLAALSTAVDRDTAASDLQLGDVGILLHHQCPEDFFVKASGPFGVSGPDGVFELFDDHGESLSDNDRGYNLRDGDAG
jgi:hypothetical protein